MIARSSDDENIYDRIVIIPMTTGPCSDCESDDDRGDKGQHTRSLHLFYFRVEEYTLFTISLYNLTRKKRKQDTRAIE